MHSAPFFIRTSYGPRPSLLLIFFALFLVCCSTTNTIKESDIQPLKIISSTISKDVRKTGGLSLPVQPTKKFTTDDKAVVSHVAFSNLTGSHNIRWDWYDPNGTLFTTTENYELETRQGMYVSEGTVFHEIKLKDSDAAKCPGDWKVKIYIDDGLFAIEDFSVQKIMNHEDIAKVDVGNSTGLAMAAEEKTGEKKEAATKKSAIQPESSLAPKIKIKEESRFGGFARGLANLIWAIKQ